MLASAVSLKRIKMAPRTRILKIGALLLSQFGLLLALNFQLFGMVTVYNDVGTETKPVFGFISLNQKDGDRLA